MEIIKKERPQKE